MLNHIARHWLKYALVFAFVSLAVILAQATPAVAAGPGNDPGMEVLNAHIMRPKGAGRAGTAGNLYYHGGNPGVETGVDKVYLVYWGSQWSTDPSGEAKIQQNFFSAVGGSSWNASVTQYCEGVQRRTVFCNGAGTAATNPSGVLGGFWYDNGGAAPSSPTQSQLAAEAANAALHFGNTSASQNAQVQYVINTATGNNASGFGTQYCAWHSSTNSTYGTLAYTNMPYITDAGGACGAGFNGLGPNAGITIVGGHEFAETETDIFPNGGWLDNSGAENGDKCAWLATGTQGAAANVSFGTASFPVQSLWSNAFNGGKGGCVNSYP